MLVSALCLPLPGLSPEAKYFLVRFVLACGEADLEALGTKGYATRFGLVERHVTTALDELVRYGILAYTIKSSGRGRPKRFYRCTADLLSKLKMQEPADSVHAALIERLIQPEEREPVPSASQSLKADRLAGLRARRVGEQLSVINRLLLAILLCYTDRFGVCRLGRSAICSASGLSQLRFASRLEQLIRSGRVRSYVAGASSDVLVTRVPNTYFINLNHPDLVGGSGHSLLLVSQVATCTSANELRHGWVLHDWCQHRKSKRSLDVDSFSLLVKCFVKQQKHVFQLLQLKIEDYAAELLSRHWGELSSEKPLKISSLLERIGNDFSPPEDVGGICKLLHDWAWELAKDIRERLSDGRLDLPLESMEYVILPHVWGRGYGVICLIAEPKIPGGIAEQRRCLVFGENGQRLGFPNEGLPEEGLTLEQRYFFGLLTRPQ